MVLPWARYWPINNCLQAEARLSFAASCEERTKIRVTASCNTNMEEENNEITCSGHWTEPGGTTYLIAKSPIDTRPYCYALQNIGFTKEQNLIMTVSRQDECRGPTEGILTIPWFPISYNVTRTGSCLYGQEGSSSGISASSASSIHGSNFFRHLKNLSLKMNQVIKFGFWWIHQIKDFIDSSTTFFIPMLKHSSISPSDWLSKSFHERIFRNVSLSLVYFSQSVLCASDSQIILSHSALDINTANCSPTLEMSSIFDVVLLHLQFAALIFFVISLACLNSYLHKVPLPCGVTIQKLNLVHDSTERNSSDYQIINQQNQAAISSDNSYFIKYTMEQPKIWMRIIETGLCFDVGFNQSSARSSYKSTLQFLEKQLFPSKLKIKRTRIISVKKVFLVTKSLVKLETIPIQSQKHKIPSQKRASNFHSSTHRRVPCHFISTKNFELNALVKHLFCFLKISKIKKKMHVENESYHIQSLL